MIKILQIIPSITVACNARSFARFARNSKNPGIDARLRLLKDEQIEIAPDELDNEAVFDDLESDFLNVNAADRQHEKETKLYKEFVSNKIVEQKYFQEQQPNFLTWSEKEQIRFLHTNNPEEWSIERIVESFPVTEEGAKKLLKVDWKPATEKRISRHDASAMRNWKELKSNELEGVTPSMREHILKFSNRVIPPRSAQCKDETVRLSLGEKNSGEFSSIITSYRAKIESEYSNKMISSENKNDIYKSLQLSDDEKKKMDKVRQSPYTLDDIRAEIGEKLENDEIVSKEDRIILSTKTEPIDNSEKNYNDISQYEAESNQNNVVTYEEKKEFRPTTYLEKIVIPKKVWKKGGTYKVDDCYYDDDGLFLYRVPGMY